MKTPDGKPILYWVILDRSDIYSLRGGYWLTEGGLTAKQRKAQRFTTREAAKANRDRRATPSEKAVLVRIVPRLHLLRAYEVVKKGSYTGEVLLTTFAFSKKDAKLRADEILRKKDSTHSVRLRYRAPLDIVTKLMTALPDALSSIEDKRAYRETSAKLLATHGWTHDAYIEALSQRLDDRPSRHIVAPATGEEIVKTLGISEADKQSVRGALTRTPADLAAILEKNGLPKAPGAIINARWIARYGDWWVKTDEGWFWLHESSKTWRRSSNGPSW